MTPQTFEIGDPWTGKGPHEMLGGFKVVNRRTVTLAQYRAEVDAATIRAKAIAAANLATMARK